MATIPIASVLRTERLPIDAQDIVTKVRLVIAGNRAGRDPDEFHVRPVGSPTEFYTSYPKPILFEHEHADHATLGAERSLSLPEGVNPFLPPTDPAIAEPISDGAMSNPGSPSAVRDGDPITFATLTSYGGLSSLRYEAAANIVGGKIKFMATSTTSFPPISVSLTPFGPSGYLTVARHRMGAPDADDQNMVQPDDGRNYVPNTPSYVAPSTNQFILSVWSFCDALEVYEFYPLVLNEPLLLDIAKANIRLPAMNPSRVTVSGYVPPDREHTIVGWPGGDFTAAVAQHQYELGRTVIDFEQAGSPTGLPAEAIEAARERNAAVSSEVRSASYSVKMGERQ